jgi:hypothetical protein
MRARARGVWALFAALGVSSCFPPEEAAQTEHPNPGVPVEAFVAVVEHAVEDWQRHHQEPPERVVAFAMGPYRQEFLPLPLAWEAEMEKRLVVVRGADHVPSRRELGVGLIHGSATGEAEYAIEADVVHLFRDTMGDYAEYEYEVLCREGRCEVMKRTTLALGSLGWSEPDN